MECTAAAWHSPVMTASSSETGHSTPLPVRRVAGPTSAQVAHPVGPDAPTSAAPTGKTLVSTATVMPISPGSNEAHRVGQHTEWERSDPYAPKLTMISPL
jgi:hypothetical protein